MNSRIPEVNHSTYDDTIHYIINILLTQKKRTVRAGYTVALWQSESWLWKCVQPTERPTDQLHGTESSL